jgi:uncharacterized protein GlcG (DUF336 family)
MEPLSMTPSHRLDGAQAYGRAADAFEAVAWKAPTAARFQTEIANDARVVPGPTVGEMIRAVPGWVVVVGGGVVAALMGALLGGALHI